MVAAVQVQQDMKLESAGTVTESIGALQLFQGLGRQSIQLQMSKLANPKKKTVFWGVSLALGLDKEQ